MDRIEETLWSDYNEVSAELKDYQQENGNERYKLLLDKQDKLRNELIELGKVNTEAKLKKQQITTEAKIKEAQIEAENKRELIRNGITIATFVITTTVSVLAIDKTFKFDEEATLTSTLGRSILSGIIPKPFKR